MVRRGARVAKEVKVAAARWQSCGSAKKPLQLRGHALPHPAAHAAYWRAVCAAARSEIREPNAGDAFFAEASARARRDRSAIDRRDRSAGPRRAFLLATRIASRH